MAPRLGGVRKMTRKQTVGTAAQPCERAKSNNALCILDG